MNAEDNVIPGRCKECFWSSNTETPVGNKVLDCNNPAGGIWGVPLTNNDFCSSFKPKEQR